ncbi:MAG: Cys-Gln thioester bond-forming surface protein [Clostridia bacterium]|nr:Cys-Gln thioester bond-forming surface protein [Clostridia bacterium]
MAKMKKILVLVLSVILCGMSIVPALAEETVSSTIEEVNEAGQTVITTTEETTTEGEDGKVIVEVTVHENITSEEGDYERDEITTTTTVTDENGKVVDTREVVEGSEVTITDKEEDDGNEAGQIEVTVQLKPGETTSNVGVSESVTTGDPQKNEEDTVYNSTTVEEVERTVEATTSEGEIKTEVEGTSEMKPLSPDRNLGTTEEIKEKQLLPEYTYSGGFEDGEPTVAPEGYDYRFTGQGQMSMYGNAIVSSEGKEGRTGALQFELEYDPDFDPNGTNDVIPAEDKFIAYCADVITGAIDNYWYRLDDLEDAGYYDEEAASHIRAIASNGYWGTSDEPDENGNLQTGSLAKLKADMKAALASGAIEGITEEEIDTITQGLAVNATQLAIWMYANETTEGDKADPSRMIAKGYAANRAERVDPSEDDVRKARAIYDFLMSREPITDEETSKIIDAESFIKEDSMSITVGDKVADHENNEDENEDNDVYDVSINFALVVTPSEDDNLIVQVVGIDAEGNASVVATGRIAGNSEGDEGFNEVAVNENGEYSLKGLNLAENSGFTFDLKLSGTQYLEEGVYIFTSEVRNGTPSQTFVGMAEGHKEVNVSQSFVIEFDVDEDNYTRTTKRWGSDTAAKKPGSGSGNGTGSNNPPRVTLSFTPAAAAADGTVEILDEEVPLAAAPETGDNSIIYVVMSLISLCGVVLLAKKRVKA